jgi:23S rRNA (cytosine1962-C5)-methyltransferase
MVDHPIELRLKPGRKHRVLKGHPWVFSNQLVEVPKGLEAGATVDVFDHGGAFVGRGYGHPDTLIAARLLERREGVAIDDAWLLDRLTAARDRRAWLDGQGRTAYRLVHGEADGLPGLVVDRYGDRLVLAAASAGMERLRPRIQAALEELGHGAGLWKCDGRGRELEGLPPVVEAGWGEVEGTWEVDDGGLRVAFDPWTGQKTGLFLDMWENRQRMIPALAAGRVLDLYSYVGQWGLQAAAAGAKEVVCVDRSAGAVELIRRNAERADLSPLVHAVEAPVDAYLRDVPDGSLDAVICDPPGFIRNRKQVSAGMKAYRTLFAHALRKVRHGGVAVLASCSHHLWEDRFGQVLEEAARWSDRRLSLLMRGGQAPCHPIPTEVPEAGYLKCVLVSVERR